MKTVRAILLTFVVIIALAYGVAKLGSYLQTGTVKFGCNALVK